MLSWAAMGAAALAGLTLAAFGTAVVSAVIGFGGGMGLMAVMTVLLPAPTVVPLHGAAQLVSNLARSYVYLSNVKWQIYLPFVGLVGVGVFAGARLWMGSELPWFQAAVGVYLLLFLGWRRLRVRPLRIPLWAFAVVGLVAGVLTVIVGAVGPFIAPFFLREDLTQHEMVATKAACQLTLHVLKIPAFLSFGFDYGAYAPLLLFLSVAVILGTLLGRRLIDRLRRESFLLGFECVLLLIAVRLLWPQAAASAQMVGF